MCRSKLVKHATEQANLLECLKKMALKNFFLFFCRVFKKRQVNCLIPYESRCNGGPMIKILSCF